MAGHSKFKNIMHRKGAQDKKRGKIFTKLIREITVAAKSGLPDPDMNPRLRAAISAARAENMPKDNVDRAIKKAVESGEGDNYENIRYEGYGAKGVAIIVEALTDNRNRTASDVRTAFTKHGGSLGETGGVSFMFDQVGEIYHEADVASDDKMFEAALEAGADNVESSEDGHIITTSVEQFGAVRDSLEKSFGDPVSAKLSWNPQTTVTLEGEDAAGILKLIDVLEDNDDVQDVFTSLELPEESEEETA